MTRAIWDGQITFGLINIPVGLYAAEKNQDLKFHLLDDRNGARVHYTRTNESTGKEVPWPHIVKGFEYTKGQYVKLSKEDFAAADLHRSQSIDLVGFVDGTSIDVRYYEKPYYLTPLKQGQKGYTLLRETLEKTGKVGIAKVVIKTREYLAALIPFEETLMMISLRYAEEVRDIEDLGIKEQLSKKAQVSPAEIKMAEQLVKSMSMDWDPEEFKDEYREKLLGWINKKAKAKGQLEIPKASRESSSNVIDIMDLLQKSLAGKSPRPSAMKPKAARSTKTAAKKPAAKKTPAKTARKSPARKRKTG